MLIEGKENIGIMRFGDLKSGDVFYDENDTNAYKSIYIKYDGMGTVNAVDLETGLGRTFVLNDHVRKVEGKFVISN